MTNHIYLQLKTIQHHPREIMRMLYSRNLMYINKHHRIGGHVFQGQNGTELIDKATYFSS